MRNHRLAAVCRMVLAGLVMTSAAPGSLFADERYFPADMLHASWVSFPARGYSAPVTGMIYRNLPRPTCGMPLGGLGTGCIDIEPNGMLGYFTVFNHLVNPRLLLNAPFLGLSVDGKTWALVSDLKGKEDRPIPSKGTLFPPTDYTPAYFDIGLKGVQIAKAIDYWGHYPILDMEYKTSAPVSVGVRAWSPMLPGDSKASMLPGTVFEVSLRNTSSRSHKGTFAFNLPEIEIASQAAPVKRTALKGKLNGVHVQTASRGDGWEIGYVVAVMDGAQVRTGGSLGTDGAAWNAVESRLPGASSRSLGAALACDYTLKAGESRTLRLVFAWYAPHWKAGGAPQHEDTKTFTHFYARHYASALAAATQLADNHQSLLKRVIAWQERLYTDRDLPGWLADCLINNLHLITECAVWGQAKPPVGTWCRPEDGLFGMNECPRGCPQIECIPCSFYGNMPVVYFYPDAALANLRGYKNYQYENGRPCWIFGGCTANLPENKQPYDIAAPDTGYQTVLNGASYLVLADRYWQRTGDREFLKEFYDSLNRANDFTLNLRPKFGMSQVMAMPEPGTDPQHSLGDTEWFEAPEPGWKGYATHAGAVRMAQVQIMKRMAREMGDTAYVRKCDEWLEAGRKVLEDLLWTGSYYLNFLDPETDTRSDLIFGYQLDGEWITDVHGVPGVFPKNRIDTALETIRKANCALSQSGATNYATPGGQVANVGGYGAYGYFPPELMMLAMNYMYEGRKEFGLDLLRRCMANIYEWGYTWDAPNTIRGDADTGQRAFGADYYQNMMLWFVPAALRGQDISRSCEKGGLLDRVIAAANGR